MNEYVGSGAFSCCSVVHIGPEEYPEAALLSLWKKLGAIPVSAMNIKFCSGRSIPLKVIVKACPLLTISSSLENLLVWCSLAFSFRCQLVLGCVAAMKKWGKMRRAKKLEGTSKEEGAQTHSEKLLIYFLQVTGTQMRLPPKLEIIHMWAFFSRISNLHRLLEVICISIHKQ